jgi:hypothetical protein
MKGSAVHLKRSTQSGASSRPADLALLFELTSRGARSARNSAMNVNVGAAQFPACAIS